MKHIKSISILISCFLIFLLSSSCKKDSLNSAPPLCDTCNTIVLNSIFLNVSNWIQQDDGSYSSDITTELKQAGISVSKIYAIDIAEGNSILQIYPETRGDYLGLSVNITVNPSKDEGTCILTFRFSSEEYFGEVRPGGLLPFSSIEIEVCFL
jgi:hypothetical protein